MNTFNEPNENTGGFLLRLLVAALLAFAGCILLALRLYILQVKYHDHYHTLA
jgi:cell division protein FtsI/penicillin-binding protein 2